jgi:GT2 family glycosyltransferase
VKTVPPLTVGLPVYNGENYLAESLEALLGQRFEDFELVISDNASTDATADIWLYSNFQSFNYFRKSLSEHFMIRKVFPLPPTTGAIGSLAGN